jgi:hypothetical protein
MEARGGFAVIPILDSWYYPFVDPSVKLIQAVVVTDVSGVDQQPEFLVWFAYEDFVWKIEDVQLISDGDIGTAFPDEEVDPALDMPSGVVTFEGLLTDHVMPGESVDYPEVPPVGGPHDQVWQTCGFYDEPVRNEHAVHSLEHGVVWITYDPDLTPAQVAVLQALAMGEPSLLISPYPNLPASVVATVWGNQLYLNGAEDPRLEQFVDYYLTNSPAPEPGASCTDGIGVPTMGG